VGAAPGARLGIVCAGKTYFDVVQAFADLGVRVADLDAVGVRVLKLAMTYPLVGETVVDFARSVDEVLVVEEKRPFVERQLRSILHEVHSPVTVTGKRDREGRVLAPTVGELNPSTVGAIVARVLPSVAARRTAEAAPTHPPIVQLPARAPAFCSGCPHNRSTVFPAGALVGGGVGCHGIMYFEARHRGMHSLAPTPMGAEGVPWIGLSPFVAEPHLIQNLGDGTLSHSGTLAVRASVAAGVDVTFKILYNSAVAMTGGQDVTGLMDVPSLTRALAAEGVASIVVCAEDPRHYGHDAHWAAGVRVMGRDRLPDVQEELRHVPGVTVIVYDQRCAAEARRMRRQGKLYDPPRRVVINEAVCEGCGDCSTTSNCLSVLPYETEFGEKRRIHESSCNRDYTCLDGDCPSFVTITPARGRSRRTNGDAPRTIRPPLPPGVLPMPPVAAVDGQYGIYFTGVGGTGVVTANRIVAGAGEAAGYVVGGMDQTGLSQMAGAVVSHLHLATDRSALGSAAVAALGADLYLSGDLLQAAAPIHLEKVRPGRTLAVVDRDVTPTAAMLQTDLAPPDPSVLDAAVADRVGNDRVVVVHAKRIAEAVFGNHLLANVVLLGAAFQAGGLPLSLDDLERGIGGTGRATGDNREAFEWGRWSVHDPSSVERVVEAVGRGEEGRTIFEPSPAARNRAAMLVADRGVPESLRELVARRTAQVIDYQHAARAERYLGLVERAAARDDAAREWALTRAVAESWFKLLTYKDEYEVARLHLLADYERVARDLGIDGAYAVRYHLHPPVLRRMGLKKKLPLGKPYEYAFRALRGMRRLRGTPFDVFGLDPDRRAERAVIEEYERLVDETIESSRGVPYDVLVDIAESPLAIKGYGVIKERSVAAWRARIADLRRADAVASTGPA
jgi:indolepyruvate ferredoxin oxidoreductase